MPEMPLYQCHKQVRAFKIGAIRRGKTFSRVYSTGVNQMFAVDVYESAIVKHNPQLGDYYVQYEDGYTSFSPAAAFEAGYSRIEGAEAPTWGMRACDLGFSNTLPIKQPTTDSVTVDGVTIPGGQRVIQGAAVGKLCIKRPAKIRVKLLAQP
jgi:hypothetical protein